jgi:hypothetical protein
MDDAAAAAAALAESMNGAALWSDTLQLLTEDVTNLYLHPKNNQRMLISPKTHLLPNHSRCNPTRRMRK